MNHGTIAIALVQRQVTIIQGKSSISARSHNRRDRWVDVYTYVPFGDRLFLASPVPKARIALSDLLTIFPFRCTVTLDMIELPVQAYQEFLEVNERHRLKYEDMWCRWKAKLRH
ncbi:hypothetical protein F5I97DRAFT_1814918 [Phlebopus sp. FC_14]|nr:hypothetical protein F5I97DRAFT_1814918 [Phlebopus sp. FC_14]